MNGYGGVMMSSKRRSKTAIAAVMALMPSLLYSGLAQATCVEELDKLKAAAAEYKRIIGGQAVLPDEIKELIRARYKKGFDGWGDGPNGGWIYAKKCLETNLATYTGGGEGWKRLCAEYQKDSAAIAYLARIFDFSDPGTGLWGLSSVERPMAESLQGMRF